MSLLHRGQVLFTTVSQAVSMIAILSQVSTHEPQDTDHMDSILDAYKYVERADCFLVYVTRIDVVKLITEHGQSLLLKAPQERIYSNTKTGVTK